jgi:hypothetical protein
LKDVGWGFAPFNNCNNVISNSLINLNRANDHAIHLGGLNPNSIHSIVNSIILHTGTDHITDRGIYCGYPGKVYINNNLISGFGVNIYLDDIEDTAFIKNNVLTGAGAGFHTEANSKIINFILSNNNIDVRSQPHQ